MSACNQSKHVEQMPRSGKTGGGSHCTDAEDACPGTVGKAAASDENSSAALVFDACSSWWLGLAAARTSAASAARFAVFFEESDADVEDATAAAIAVAAPATARAKVGVVGGGSHRPVLLCGPVSLVNRYRLFASGGASGGASQTRFPSPGTTCAGLAG